MVCWVEGKKCVLETLTYTIVLRYAGINIEGIIRCAAFDVVVK